MDTIVLQEFPVPLSRIFNNQFLIKVQSKLEIGTRNRHVRASLLRLQEFEGPGTFLCRPPSSTGACCSQDGMDSSRYALPGRLEMFPAS